MNELRDHYLYVGVDLGEAVLGWLYQSFNERRYQVHEGIDGRETRDGVALMHLNHSIDGLVGYMV